MHVLKTILAVAVVILAVGGVLLAGVGIYYSWALNTPVTQSLTEALAGAERLLTAADGALTRANGGLERAEAAVNTIEGAVTAAGETVVETDLAFLVLERTVGDTLFPAVATAHETLLATTEMIVSFNDTLEAMNRLPLVDVPTLTAELQTAADQVAAAQQTVEEIRAEMRVIKEEQVSRPVTFVTDRTGPLLDGLGQAQAAATRSQANIAATMTAIAARQATLARTVDLLSLGTTAVLLWLIAAQALAGERAVRYLQKGTAH